MKLPQGLVLVCGFNFSAVKFTAVVGWEVKYPCRAPFD